MFPAPLAEEDWISVSVVPVLPQDAGSSFTITLSLADGTVLAAPVERLGLDGQAGARFYWALQAPEGEVTLELTATLATSPGADPDLSNNAVALSLPLLKRESLPPPEPEASWATTETNGFSLHYLMGSAAERDLSEVVMEASQAYSDVVAVIGVPSDPVEIYLLDRVIGQGGYASGAWAAISYADRRYSPVTLGSVLRHELTHHVQAKLGCDGAASLIQEGLAVHVSGGHYRKEPIHSRAAALVGGEYYIPLLRLVEAFYTYQHEVSYMEAASLVGYIVESSGWSGIEELCRAMTASEAEDALGRFESGLEAVGFGTLAALEAAWLDWLSEVPTTPADRYAFEIEVRLMDTMRGYQRMYDPGAHFLIGILLDPEEGARRDIVADFARRPIDPQAIALELLLAGAQDAVLRRDYVSARTLVDLVQAALKAPANAWPDVAVDVLGITQLLLSQGFEPYRLTIVNDDVYRVEVLDRDEWPAQRSFVLQREGDVWSRMEAGSAE